MAKTSPNAEDWSPDRIKMAVYEIGISIRELSRLGGAAANVCGAALARPHARGEQIIARALGIPPQEIWPSRYQRPRAPRHYHKPDPTTLDALAQRLKNGVS